MSADKYMKYRRMLRMGVPSKQVEVAMRMDGLDPEGFDYVDDTATHIGGNSTGDASSLFLGGTEMRGDALDKYRKMIKCGLPQGAVEQKMIQDGIDPSRVTVANGVAPPSKAATGKAQDKRGEELLSSSKTGKKKMTMSKSSSSSSTSKSTSTEKAVVVAKAAAQTYPAQVLYQSTMRPIVMPSTAPKSELMRSLVLCGIVGVALALGVMLRNVHALRIFRRISLRLMTIAFASSSWFMVLIWQDLQLNHKLKRELITSALPFSVLRNPYDLLSAVLLCMTLASLTNHFLVFFVLFPVYLAALHLLVIPVEEQELRNEFGAEAFNSFARKVKRWGVL